MTVTLHHGNCLDILPTLPDCSIDSIVTDPPYELGFMGKKWDASGIAYNITLWQECLRVLKPGGHLLAFGGTRTYHRMACAIEDSGFEIRDSIHWLYGSGFPKSLDVSKAIDKQAGAERQVVGTAKRAQARSEGWNRPWMENQMQQAGSTVAEFDITAPATDAAKQWVGWGTALKPAHEPIVVARKPLIGTVAQNVLEWGTGAINIDASRIGHASEADLAESLAKNPGRGDTVTFDVYGANRPQQSVNSAGRWPANVILSHHEDCDAECVAGCPVALLDEQSGTSKDGVAVRRNGNQAKGLFGVKIAEGSADVGYGGSGGASRFFYCAKPSRRERNTGLDHLPTRRASAMGYDIGLGEAGEGMFKDRNPQKQNHHPTVKPLALMRYLVRLVTPPGGTVLEPFAGSGTTLMACVLENFDAIGIEMTDEYLPIIEGRVAWAQAQATKQQEELF